LLTQTMLITASITSQAILALCIVCKELIHIERSATIGSRVLCLGSTATSCIQITLETVVCAIHTHTKFTESDCTLTKMKKTSLIALSLIGLAVGSTTLADQPDDVHHPNCPGLIKDLGIGAVTPVDGIVYIKAGPNHVSIGYQPSGYVIPATFGGKDTSHGDVCPETSPEETTSTTQVQPTTTTIDVSTTTSSSETTTVPQNSQSTTTTENFTTTVPVESSTTSTLPPETSSSVINIPDTSTTVETSSTLTLTSPGLPETR